MALFPNLTEGTSVAAGDFILYRETSGNVDKRISVANFGNTLYPGLGEAVDQVIPTVLVSSTTLTATGKYFCIGNLTITLPNTTGLSQGDIVIIDKRVGDSITLNVEGTNSEEIKAPDGDSVTSYVFSGTSIAYFTLIQGNWQLTNVVIPDTQTITINIPTQLQSNKTYFANSSSPHTLPASPSIGDYVVLVSAIGTTPSFSVEGTLSEKITIKKSDGQTLTDTAITFDYSTAKMLIFNGTDWEIK